MASEKIQAIRGMNDILPSTVAQWQTLEKILVRCLSRYGYQEIRFPLVENTQLFKRTIGEVTDVVEKEMYTFNDLNGDSLTLRPEGTAGCLRACIEHGLLHNQQQKLWYFGPMFRHERPQKGRYRQFHQFGVEALGITGHCIEIEMIAMGQRFWQTLGLSKFVHLQINTLGDFAERQRYKESLVTYLTAHYEHLDEDSRRRLTKNPLRILDSKNPDIQSLLTNAPRLIDFFEESTKERFKSLCAGLDRMGIAYVINPFLVRGLDYYGQTVFEWVTDKLGSQATLCAGGRYDALVEHLGGNAVPAVGFAMGAERLLLLMETVGLSLESRETLPTIFIMASHEEGLQEALIIAEELRDSLPNWRVITHLSGGGFKAQFKKADKSGAEIALIIGEDELRNRQISVKNLRKKEEQMTINKEELKKYLEGFGT